MQFSEAKKSTQTIKIDGKTYAELIDNHPAKMTKMNYYNKQGWGFKDSGFIYDKEKKSAKMNGDRYLYKNEYLPALLPYLQDVL
jgi:hypothetical protein